MDRQLTIEYLKNRDAKLSKVIDRIGTLSITNHSDSFIFLVNEVVGQMISSKVRDIIYNRLIDLVDYSITPSNIINLTIEQLRSTGLSLSKCRYIQNLAHLVRNGDIDFRHINTLPDNEVLKVLTSIKGIGNWTAKMYLIFYLQREDVLPYEDGAFLQAYKWLYNTNVVKPDSIARRCKKWKPYTSIGARYMYRALDTGLTKIPIKDFLEK